MPQSLCSENLAPAFCCNANTNALFQGVMERVCTLPAPVVQDVVALALHLLCCPQDPARRNAALFFGASFVFRSILEAFDAQDGLCKLVNLLRNTASLRSGGASNSGTAAANAGAPLLIIIYKISYYPKIILENCNLSLSEMLLGSHLSFFWLVFI